jgi:phenylacetic acid degradation operon negative regulatory protein
VTEAGARKALSRLTERKVLVRTRLGRGTYYRVSEANLAVRLARRRRYLSFGEHRSEWDGSWTVVVFSVAERERSIRAALRSGLAKVGFAPMADAVWVHPGDARVEAWAVINELGANSAVLTARFDEGGAMNPADAYDLSPVRAAYEELIAHHEPIAVRMRSGMLAPAEAFVLRARLMDSWRSVVISDPDLPSELLPADWPRSRARVLFLELMDGLGPLALERLKGLVAESDPEGASRLAHHLLASADAELAVGRGDVPSAAG